MRKTIVVIMVIGGFALQVASYFSFSAPLGRSTSEFFSNPRIPYAPLFFILGIMLVFSAAVVYELLPDREG